jgi:hypothetical protein
MRAWTSMDLSPARINDVCNRAEQQHDLSAMVAQALALYDTTDSGSVVSVWASMHLLGFVSLC